MCRPIEYTRSFGDGASLANSIGALDALAVALVDGVGSALALALTLGAAGSSPRGDCVSSALAEGLEAHARDGMGSGGAARPHPTSASAASAARAVRAGIEDRTLDARGLGSVLRRTPTP
jgi:hypothetical protein